MSNFQKEDHDSIRRSSLMPGLRWSVRKEFLKIIPSKLGSSEDDPEKIPKNYIKLGTKKKDRGGKISESSPISQQDFWKPVFNSK